MSFWDWVRWKTIASLDIENWWMMLGLLLVPLGIFAYLAVQKRRAQYAVRFTNLDLLANIVDKTPGWHRHVPTAFYLGAVAALVVAMSRPTTEVDVPRERATVILVTDVSGSMNATDVEPTRLLAAQEAGNVLVDELPEKFQVGLVSFSNAVTVVVPPTIDHEAVKAGLLRLKSNGGTAMGDGLQAALDQIELVQQQDAVLDAGPGATPTPTPTPDPDEDGDSPAVIVLLSDGAQTVGRADPLEIAAIAQARNIPIFTIALGTQDGVVDITDSQGRIRRLAVPPDEETLQAIADTTDAKFFSAPTEDDLKSVYEELGSRIGKEEEERNFYGAFAGLAALLLLAGGGLSMLWFNRLP